MQKQNDKRPEDIFIGRYMPGASEEEREDARQNVQRLIAILVRINDRVGRESDSRESDSWGRFEEPDTEPAL
jgi:hypothetical protein